MGIDLKVELFADGADLETIAELCKNPLIRGFTTNPTLMHKAGVTNYKSFAQEALKLIGDRSISFEVIADDFDEMGKQAREIASWGENIYVKIPITNTKGRTALYLINELSSDYIKVNVTALMTYQQIGSVCLALYGQTPCYISVFGGRIADTGRDPIDYLKWAINFTRYYNPCTKVIWASPRELLNIFQADEIDCDIITVTPDILKKLSLVGRDLFDYSLETVRMFYDDAKASGYAL